MFDYSGNATIYYLPGTTGWTNPWGGRPTVLLPYDYANTNGAITITGHVGSNSVVTIPDEIEGLPVVSINNSAFQSSTNVTRITIPSSVTNLGSQVFDPCINLNGVYFRGNAPTVGTGVLGLHLLGSGNNGTVYYLPGTKGWEDTFLGLPTTLWRPQISGDSSFGVRTNKFGFNINWASGQMIVTEACTNVANSSWVPLQTNILASDTYYFSDLNWVNYPNRYYRVTTTQ